ncbi:MAG TPA: FmdB family zinc ribbon protein [Phototrophicaceae bacterium]|nr:FmdB family zinc ribbon protein [Phototrophicaceae bacterium]
MPVYEYRCNGCGRKAALFYKSYKDYDQANAKHLHTCPHCGSRDLTRLISRVAIQKGDHNYAAMSSDQMLSVLNGGDSREVGRMMHELGQDQAVGDPAFGEITDRLMKGEDPARIESDLSGTASAASAADSE